MEDKHILGEFKPSDMDIRLYELAKEYHEKTEEYDRTVCSVKNERGVAMPANGYELALINRNAYAVRERILKENTDITSTQLHRAISRHAQSSDKSPSPCRHTLEDGADATTELVSGKSSGFIGGMR